METFPVFFFFFSQHSTDLEKPATGTKYVTISEYVPPPFPTDAVTAMALKVLLLPNRKTVGENKAKN